MVRVVSLCLILTAALPAAAVPWCFPYRAYKINVRTMTQYLTWRSQPEDLTEPGRMFNIPEAEKLDGVDKVSKELQALCLNLTAEAPADAQCFNSNEMDKMSAWASHKDRSTTMCGIHTVSKTSGHLGNSIHTVVKATPVPADRVTVCHNSADTYACHYLNAMDAGPPQIYRVVTNSTSELGFWENAVTGDDQSQQATLVVICHHAPPKQRSGCHILAPSDVIFPGLCIPSQVV